MSTTTTHALIICNGPLPGKLKLQKLAAQANKIICADGGANRALRRGLQPDVIIGDLDSVTPETRLAFDQVRWIHKVDQESTDLEKVLDWALSQGISSATVVGATGRRSDHTLANFSILAKYSGRMRLEFIDSHCRMRILEENTILDLKIGTTLSLLPLGRCEGITTEGLAYPLRDEALELGVREGLSNQVVFTPVRISLRRGKLLLFEVLRP